MLSEKIIRAFFVFCICGFINRDVPILREIEWPVYKIFIMAISVIYLFRLFISVNLRKRYCIISYLLFFLLLFVWACCTTYHTLTILSAHVCYLMPIFPFYFWNLKNEISRKEIIIVFSVFLVVSIYSFWGFQRYLSDLYIGRDDATNNIGYYFVPLIPYLYFINNNKLKMVLGSILLFFTIASAKRGALVCVLAGILLLVFYSSLNRNKLTTRSFFAILIYFTVFFFLSMYFIENDDYTLYRLKNTFEDNVEFSTYSGRDIIYTKYLSHYYNSDIINLIFGYGYNGTLRLFQLRAHNDWIEILIDFGLMGFFVYFAFFCTMFARSKKEFDKDYRYSFYTCIILFFLQTLFSMGFLTGTMTINSFLFSIFFARADNATHNNRLLKKKKLLKSDV